MTSIANLAGAGPEDGGPGDDRQAPVIVWFRNDLRCGDHPALSHAAGLGRPVLAVYVHDEETNGVRPMGAAQKWFLHQSLSALGDALSKAGCRLRIFQGKSETVLGRLAEQTGASSVYWLRRTGGAETAMDSRLKMRFQRAGIEARSFNGNLLHEPSRFLTGSGGPYKVYTPFFKALLRQGELRPPLPAPKKLQAFNSEISGTVSLDAIRLQPEKPNWAQGWETFWPAGEAGARELLAQFLQERSNGYSQGRDFPARNKVSRLSPYLRFGILSPRQLWYAARQHQEKGTIGDRDASKFLSELGWREFCHHLLFHFPDLPVRNFQQKFDAFPWRSDETQQFERWKKGQTGYPVVDAGMRELWQTGYMHNRIRMVAASFLVKHLLADWRIGERWFWDTLVDGDGASNPANWQWVAGCGADAAPYFRIFNPVLQGRKFDPDGGYVRRFVPEIANLPDKYLHAPWEAPKSVLETGGIVLGETYPEPMVDHATARQRALAALKEVSGLSGNA
ncbi:cryptochrome/photolyase family protein [Salaquimonas pukyongi]|uniref:cryptochrome/photolyase family protein n=1 Tax=Salaquimonas pukyongi TaxID=2712698 RepID=UPI0009FB2734|nr:deoxyribodipyrimidine photo-lyase [Salaquimonas pukyongi]